jgi:hypothetical protein
MSESFEIIHSNEKTRIYGGLICAAVFILGSAFTIIIYLGYYSLNGFILVSGVLISFGIGLFWLPLKFAEKTILRIGGEELEIIPIKKGLFGKPLKGVIQIDEIYSLEHWSPMVSRGNYYFLRVSSPEQELLKIRSGDLISGTKKLMHASQMLETLLLERKTNFRVIREEAYYNKRPVKIGWYILFAFYILFAVLLARLVFVNPEKFLDAPAKFMFLLLAYIIAGTPIWFQIKKTRKYHRKQSLKN